MNKTIRGLCYFFSLLTVSFFVLLLALFAWQSVPAWKHEGAGYVLGKIWEYRQQTFGMLPMIYGSMAVSAIALAIAVPLGVGAAVFSAEYLGRRARAVVKTAIELLAGVPSVVYGLLGLLFLRSWVFHFFDDFGMSSGDSLLTAGMLLAIMVLPTIMTLSDDALRSVPSEQKLAARSLGLSQGEAILGVSLTQARPGIVAAVLLGCGRAMGETIAVFLVVGRLDNQWPQNLFSLGPLLREGQTITSKLGSSETAISFGDPLHWGAIVGLGLVLLILVLFCTVFAQLISLRVSRTPR